MSLKSLRTTLLAGVLCAAASTGSALTLSVDVQEFSFCSGSSVDATCDADVDRSFINRIFAQVGIVLNFLTPVREILNATFTTSPSFPGEIDPDETLLDFRASAPRPLADNTIHLAYVPNLYGGTVGLAFVGAPSSEIAFAIADSQTLSTIDLSLTVAHEIGHILGAEHTFPSGETIPDGFLMAPNFDTGILTADSVVPITAVSAARMQSSPLLTPVPLPPALAMLAAALLSLWLLRGASRREPAPA